MHPSVFPHLDDDGCEVTGPPDDRYNCLAWAVGDTGRWWWPHDGRYWPEGVPRDETLDAILAALESVGFRAVPAPDPTGECVAVYAKAGVPTHMAKRLPDGRWSSKLGGNVLVTHATPHGVEGPLYGDVVRYLSRPVPTA